jgi:phenylalanyl-tRNA synthetase beta chain
MKVSYQWLCELLPGLAEIPAADAARRLTFAGLEVEEIAQATEGDAVFTLNVTPNRGDCLSHWGVARELAALTGLTFVAPSLHGEKDGQRSGERGAEIAIDLHDAKNCPRYAGSEIRGVKVAASPAWLADRLTALGQRPINNIVDATNYLMLLAGHPAHAFDADKLRGGQIVIAGLTQPTRFKALDQAEYTLEKGDLVIRDAHGPVALAGVIGGEGSAVDAGTRNVFLETASFDPVGVRRTARRVGVITESSYRFERGVNPTTIVLVNRMLRDLIVKLAGGQGTAVVDVYPQPIPAVTLNLPFAEVTRVLGITIPAATSKNLLTALGCGVREGSGDAFIVTVPQTRSDLTRPIDLIEEIARIHGLDKIPAVMPAQKLRQAQAPRTAAIEPQLKGFLVNAGFAETIHYSFGDENAFTRVLRPVAKDDWIRLKNPLSEELAVLRPSLLPQLLATYEKNAPLVQKGLRFYECRSVYRQSGQAITERRVLAGLYGGNPHGRNRFGLSKASDFFDGKGVLEGLFAAGRIIVQQAPHCDWPFHPEQAVTLSHDGTTLATHGALHPEILQDSKIPDRLYYFELDVAAVSALYGAGALRFTPISPLPPVYRDMAILAPTGLTHQEILQAIDQEKPAALIHVELFDLYAGKSLPAGKKSLAYAFIYAAGDTNLTDAEVNAMHFALVEKLQKRLGVQLR